MSIQHEKEETLAIRPISLAKMTSLVAASPLQLRYVFTSSPNPIRASAGGANPNVVDLQIMISNPQTFAVAMNQITIRIPIGEDTARALSTMPQLPSPLYDTTGQWSITASADTITIIPADGSTGELTGTILFSIQRIMVNAVPGTVPITVTEFSGSGRKQTDTQTYSLVKLPSDFPVTDFYATPTALDDLSLTSTLSWRCSNDGANYSYSVASQTWQPKNCLNGGDCFTCADGSNGIPTPELYATTTFALEVIGADAGGNRVVHGTLFTTVRVEVPSIAQNLSCVPLTRSGNIVSLHWMAYNSVRCSILVNGVEIESNAPANTYRNGHIIILPSTPGVPQLTLLAHGAGGGTPASLPFPSTIVQTPATIPIAGNACSLAITPDGKRAFVAEFQGKWSFGPIFGGGRSYAKPFVEVVDLVQKRVTSSIPIELIPSKIVITKDGRFAAVISDFLSSAIFHRRTDAISVIDTAGLTESLRVTGGGFSHALGSGESGSNVLVSTSSEPFGHCSVRMVDLSTSSNVDLGNIDHIINAVATTPDGKMVVAIGQAIKAPSPAPVTTDIIIINVGEPAQAPISIPFAVDTMSVAITPDGALALLVGEGEELTVVDLRNRRIEPRSIHIGPGGYAQQLVDAMSIIQLRSLIAISPDGKFAAVLRQNGTQLVVVDIPGRRAAAQTIATPQSFTVAITPDSKNIVVTGATSIMAV